MRVSQIAVPIVVGIPLALAGAAPAGAATPTTPRALPPTGLRVSQFAVVDRGRAVGLKRDVLRSLPRRGARVGIACADVPDPESGSRGEISTSTPVRRRVRLRIPKGNDFCVVKVKVVKRARRSTTITTPAVGTIAVTPAGAEYVHERALARLMDTATQLALTGANGDRTPTTAQVVKALSVDRLLGRPLAVVSAPGPRTPVPAGTLGVFFDGTRTSMTARTPGGRLLHLDYDRTTQEVATNVLPALNDTTGDDLMEDVSR